MGRLLAGLFAPRALSRLWVICPHSFRSRRASVGHAYETGPQKIKPHGYDPVGRPIAFPSRISFAKKDGLDSGTSSPLSGAIFRGVRLSC
jgi:hypothetical protein